MNNRVNILDLGRMDYKPSWDFQKKFHQDVLTGKETDTLILVEHEPVYTLGKNANKEHLLDKTNSRVMVYNVERGGDITFHGPGQLVIYFLLNIKQKKLGPKALVANLQNLIENILKHYSIESYFIEGAPGVYVGEKKIASIGLRISKGRSYHGISLNVDMDLTPFSLINPCGYEGLEVTQICHFDSNVTLEDVESVAVKEMQLLFS